MRQQRQGSRQRGEMVLKRQGDYNNQDKRMEKAQNSQSNQATEGLGDQICSIGQWSFNQNLLYVIFLQKNKQAMASKKRRRHLRIFDQMAEFLTTRNSLQCRSHHQKVLQKFGQISKIICNFKKYITKQQFKAKLEEVLQKATSERQAPCRDAQIKLQALDIQPLQASPQASLASPQASLASPQALQASPQAVPLPAHLQFAELQHIDNSYLVQLNRQLSSYALFGYYYPYLQRLT